MRQNTAAETGQDDLCHVICKNIKNLLTYTRRNHFITYKGQTKTLAQWAEEKNINAQTLISRINESKWSVEKALETPVKKKKNCPKLHEKGKDCTPLPEK